MAVWGYARVSTTAQDPAMQVSALHAAGCDRVVEEHASGRAGRARPVMTALLADLYRGDTLMVWRLDRLGRSTADLLEIVADLDARGVALRSLGESLDTTTPAGRLVLTVLAAVAQMERERGLERVHAGIAEARTRPGYRHGRPPKLTPAQVDLALEMRAHLVPQRTAALKLGVARQTLARTLAAADARKQGWSRDRSRHTPEYAEWLRQHAEGEPERRAVR